MQLGHDHFGCRSSLLLVEVDRNAAAVVFDGDRIVRVDADDHLVRVAGERLIDGVIDDFVHHVMQPGNVIGVADVHARPLAYGVESLEYFDVFCGVVFGHQLSFELLILAGGSRKELREDCTALVNAKLYLEIAFIRRFQAKSWEVVTLPFSITTRRCAPASNAATKRSFAEVAKTCVWEGNFVSKFCKISWSSSASRSSRRKSAGSSNVRRKSSSFANFKNSTSIFCSPADATSDALRPSIV